MRSKTNSIAGSTRVQGFTLVEVLIALIILSVGMLGIAGLYVHSMQAGRTSLFRHHAVTLVGDIADRIRANPRAGAAYTGAGANSNCVDGGIDCTPAEMAANDAFLWGLQAADTLPTGTVVITFNNGPIPPTYQILVQWNEPEGARSYSITIPVFPI
jgi:type IV pilus assembly protein PilV